MNQSDKELIDVLWKVYDKDDSGELEPKEFKKFVSHLLGKKPDRKSFKEMLKFTDKDKDGKIQKEELMDFIKSLEEKEE